jgi:AraC-like DNA-binding protein
VVALPLTEYLQKERMGRAYELLQDEGNTVASVAEAVGFSHPCNFSTAFWAHSGCTPKQAAAIDAKKSRFQTIFCGFQTPHPVRFQ